MHAFGTVTSLREGLGRVARYADNRIGVAERPGDPAAHSVAVVDVCMDEGFCPGEGREDNAGDGIAWPIRGMEDGDAVEPYVCGEPQQTRSRRQRAGDAGKLLKICLLP